MSAFVQHSHCADGLTVRRSYGHEVEAYLDVYMRTPDLPEDDVAKALLARGKARKDAAQLLLMRAELGKMRRFPSYAEVSTDKRSDFQSAAHVDPTNREAQAHLRRRRLVLSCSEWISTLC